MAIRVFLILLAFLGTRALASELDEDVSAESDAAMAQTKEVHDSLMKDKQDNERAHREVVKARDAAVASRQQALEEYKNSEAEIQSLKTEQVKLTAEIAQMKKENEATQKVLAENKTKAEKAKAELLALHELKTETSKRVIELGIQLDKVNLDIRTMDEERAAELKAFKEAKEQEKLTADKIQKAQAEMIAKKAIPEPNSDPGVATDELKLKRDCKIYDKSSNGLKVVGVKPNGSAVHKSEEGSNWISFLVADGQKYFLSKRCFQ